MGEKADYKYALTILFKKKQGDLNTEDRILTIEEKRRKNTVVLFFNSLKHIKMEYIDKGEIAGFLIIDQATLSRLFVAVNKYMRIKTVKYSCPEEGSEDPILEVLFEAFKKLEELCLTIDLEDWSQGLIKDWIEFLLGSARDRYSNEKIEKMANELFIWGRNAFWNYLKGKVPPLSLTRFCLEKFTKDTKTDELSTDENED
ncbi:MAG: hypothetical protein Q6351_005880 [Candidatus Njordarchaeum guaymaensis]